MRQQRPHGGASAPASRSRANRPQDAAGPQVHGGGSGGAAGPRAQAAAAPKPRRSRYIPALDGLRTLAVVAVVLYHLNLTWAQGGLIGVTMFFVLSGYLITRLLLAEFDQSGTIDLKDFWLRRVRRLVPAILTVVIATIVLCTLFNHVMLTKMRPDIIPSLLFFNNWWQIFNNVSYFNALGDPSPLTHFWSLAIEEQFYLVWPPVLFLILKLSSRGPATSGKRFARIAALVIATVSAVAMMALYSPAADPSRIYYGTDTRVFSLLLGAWLAFIPEGRMRPVFFLRAIHLDRLIPALAENHPVPAVESGPAGANGPAPAEAAGGSGADAALGANVAPAPSPLVRMGLSVQSVDLIGVIGLIGLTLMVAFTNGYTSFQYQGGTLLCSMLTLMVIAACVQPEGRLARILSWGPLVWLGKRSYSIYLWHYPLLLLMNPVADITEKPWWAYIIQALIVVAAAELSYRFIETPFRNGAFGRFIKRARTEGLNPRGIFRTNPIPVTACTIMLAIAVGGLVFVPDTSALSADGAAALNQGAASTGGDAQTTQQSDAAATDSQTPDDHAAAGDGDAATTTGGTTDTSNGSDAIIAGEDGFPEGSYDVLMIGDSVSLRAVPEFQSTFPHGHIDAAQSRQFSAGEAAYESYVQQNLAGRIAVFALGTNGLVTDEAIDSLMADVGEDRIAVFVNTRSPQPWVQATNEAIGRAPERYANARVIDWFSYSAGRNDLFDGDGTHLSASGAREYIQLVYDAVKDDLPVHPEDHANDAQVVAVRNAADSIANAIAAR